jgi:hypothetical protein
MVSLYTENHLTAEAEALVREVRAALTPIFKKAVDAGHPPWEVSHVIAVMVADDLEVRALINKWKGQTGVAPDADEGGV